MLEKLKKVEEKFEFISAELCKSEVVSASTRRLCKTQKKQKLCSTRAAPMPN